MLTRRTFFQTTAMAAAGAFYARTPQEFDVHRFGAAGDGVTNDTQAIQKAIDTAAAAGGGRVLLRGGKRYLTGSLKLRSRIDFHLADDAVVLASTTETDYLAEAPGVLTAAGAVGLSVTGTGNIDGQAMKFMTGYSETDQRWEPKPFRPRMFSLHRCKDMEIREISFGHSPNWGLHMLGCDRVLVDGIRIRNYMDVPNCDGIDPDHCRDVEIRNCDIVCADDGIVIKTSEQKEDYGPSYNLTVSHCQVTTRDSGFKIGTETCADISKVRFDQCKVLSGGRGPTITHRQRGNISDVEFSNMEVVAEHHAARWWGWGEAISITAWHRTEEGEVGRLRDIRIRNLKARAENSVHIDGTLEKPIENVLLENVEVTIDHWTNWPGGKFDNRPTGPDMQGLEPHRTPVYFIRNVDQIVLRDCRARWGTNRQDDFSYALETENVSHLLLDHFEGEAAFPERDKPIKRAEK